VFFCFSAFDRVLPALFRGENTLLSGFLAAGMPLSRLAAKPACLPRDWSVIVVAPSPPRLGKKVDPRLSVLIVDGV
jgi:hypothetical protein